MKSIALAAALAAGFATTAVAEVKLEKWQEDALQKVREYSRVRDAAWQPSGALWLFAYEADIAWNNIADQVTCNHLRDVGMPAGKSTLVVFYEFGAAIRGQGKRMGEAFCN